MTCRLYDSDAYIKSFKASVLSCEKAENGLFKTVLSRTAFFPEGGGQSGDRGYIGQTEILDTKIQNGEIYHFSKLPIDTLAEVNCTIDFKRRFSFMQNHTGEHIVSGMANKLFGLENVGFHLGEDFATIDLNGSLDRKTIDIIENAANEKVWQNLKVRAYYPEDDELSGLNYRSKKEIVGRVRIVEIEATDTCACCAPHVKATGEIGVIKLLSAQKVRFGTRIILKCGSFALADYKNKFLNISKISDITSSPAEDTADAVLRLENKISELKQTNSELKLKFIKAAAELADKSKCCLFEKDFDMKELQASADLLSKKTGKPYAVFSEKGEGYSFAFCGQDGLLMPLFEKFKKSFEVRGGGRNGIVQGTVNATENEITEFFERNGL